MDIYIRAHVVVSGRFQSVAGMKYAVFVDGKMMDRTIMMQMMFEVAQTAN